MKIRVVSLLTFLLITISGCSEQKEEQKENMQNVEFVKQKPRKSRLLIPDTSRIVRLRDFDPQDSVLVAARAFNRAEKDFIKKWNYGKDRTLFVRVVEQICRESRQCPAMKDSVAYQKEVYFILDSLMQNNILDSAINAKKQEIEERKNNCHYQKIITKECHKQLNKEITEYVKEELKRRRNKK